MKLMQEIRRLIRSFSAAFQGVYMAFRDEKNMQIHGWMAVLVTGLSCMAGISWHRYLVLLFLVVWVWILELINTSIERTLDLISTETHPKIKLAKDTAAGAVLLSAIFAVLVGITLLYQPLAEKVGNLNLQIMAMHLTSVQLAILICIWLASMAVLIKWSSWIKERFWFDVLLTTLSFLIFMWSERSSVQLFALLLPVAVMIFIYRNHFYFRLYKLGVSGLGAFVLFYLLR